MRLILLIMTLSLCTAACNNSKTSNEKTGATGKEVKTPGGDDELVEDVLNRYKEYTVNEDFEEMLKLTSPTLLEKTSNDEMIKMLQAGMHNENYDISIRDIEYDDISNIIKKDRNKYALAKTRTAGSLKIKNQSFETFCKMFKNQYEKVTCDEGKKTVDFEMKGEVYVIYSNGDKKWFIISNTDPDSIEEWIPADIRQKLGIRIQDEE